VDRFKQASSEELMIIYQVGSPENAILAFEELYFRYSDRVYAYCLKRLIIKADVEDILQKIFLKIHESKHLYNSKFRFEQWIFVIAKTSVLDALRTRTSDIRKIEGLLNSIEESLPRSEKDELGLLELSHLTNDQKNLLEWKYVDELSYKEISTILEKSEMSIRKMVSRLVLKVRNGGA
jgi:RNA polymerase sigma-70 factor (ECF subfamily)